MNKLQASIKPAIIALEVSTKEKGKGECESNNGAAYQAVRLGMVGLDHGKCLGCTDYCDAACAQESVETKMALLDVAARNSPINAAMGPRERIQYL